MSSKPSILVVGAGYVGLATAVFFARKGYVVKLIEKKREIVTQLKKGRLHFHEPTLRKNLLKVIQSKHLLVNLPAREAYQGAEFIFIAIDSADRKNWQMDLGPFKQMAGWIGAVPRKRPAVVVLKSTNVVGFAERFSALLMKTPHGKHVSLAVNPEFLREGYAYEDTSSPWRIVIGTGDAHTRARLVKLYRTVYRKSIPIIADGWRAAELIKLASNLYLAHRLTFINEVAEFCRMQDLDIDMVTTGIGSDPRIGGHYLQPGLGFAGACLPKDCRFINAALTEGKFTFQTARTALRVNDEIVENVVRRLRKHVGTLAGKRIAILGTAFKPDTDDTRESQALRLAWRLLAKDAQAVLYDPFVAARAGRGAWKVHYAGTVSQAVKGACVVVVGAAHSQFKLLQPSRIKKLMKSPVVCDNFRILDRAQWERAGFEFI